MSKQQDEKALDFSVLIDAIARLARRGAQEREILDARREGTAVTTEQLPLLSYDLPPLALHQRVRVIAEDYIGEVVQVWEGHDHYAVYTVPWRGQFDQGLPIYRRDELEAL